MNEFHRRGNLGAPTDSARAIRLAIVAPWVWACLWYADTTAAQTVRRARRAADGHSVEWVAADPRDSDADAGEPVGDSAPEVDETEEPADELPPPGEDVHIPLAGEADESRLEMTGEEGVVLRLVARSAPLGDILALLAERHGLNLVFPDEVDTRISVTLEEVSIEDALTNILAVAGYSWSRRNGIILISPLDSASRLGPEIQGRQLRVFELDYLNASDVADTVTGLLSPVGRSFTMAKSKTDNRRSREVVVVEDLPGYVESVALYLAEVDEPPRQVLIEAHILKVDLKGELKNGVNLTSLFRMFGAELTLQAQGFAVPTAPQAVFATFNSTDFDMLVECLMSTTDAKTLAAPRLLVVNGQEARFQVGGQLGFRVTTTTQTSTLQSVDFLDVGVVLRVTPHISRDHQVLMHVKPEVSSGRINPETQLPEAETTQADTDTLLADGQGIIIGGLIQEKDSTVQSKVPFIGDWWLIGRLFQRNQVTRERSEIIIALVPRIVPYDPEFAELDSASFEQAVTPLFSGPLLENERPWEPELFDAVENPRPIADLIPRPLVPRRNRR